MLAILQTAFSVASDSLLLSSSILIQNWETSQSFDTHILPLECNHRPQFRISQDPCRAAKKRSLPNLLLNTGLAQLCLPRLSISLSTILRSPPTPRPSLANTTLSLSTAQLIAPLLSFETLEKELLLSLSSSLQFLRCKPSSLRRQRTFCRCPLVIKTSTKLPLLGQQSSRSVLSKRISLQSFRECAPH